jgi:hypothetical protein
MAERHSIKNGPLQGAILRLGAMNRELSVPGLRSLSPLSDKAQVLVDKVPVQVGLERLAVVAALMEAGLTYDLPDPLSVTQLEWDQESKVGGARRTMLPTSRGENALIDRKHLRLPIYCTLGDFSMNIRLLKMSERVGAPLDTSTIEQEVRRVNESIEDATIYGATTLDGQQLVDSSYNVPGMLTPPGTANVTTLSVDWTAANVIGTTGPAMAADVLAMVAKANAANKFGPFMLVIGTTAGAVIQGQFSLYQTGTIQNMLESMKFGSPGQNLKIVIADRMPNTVGGPTQQVALVQMTSDVIQIVNGQAPTVVPYTSLDGWTLFWTVLAIQVPRVRADYNGQSGIVIGSK